MAAAKPIHEIRLGMIKVAVWRTNTRVGERHNVTVCRLFKNGDVWAQSQHFGRDDLLLVAKAMDLAHTWIYSQQHHEAHPQESSP